MDKVVIKGNTPSKSNCYKIISLRGKNGKSHGSLAKTPALKKYEESFLWQCGTGRGKMIDTPFKLELEVYYPSKRTDLDNSLKVILDCMQKAKMIKNDNLLAELHARKFIDKDNPRCEFTITEI